MQIEYVLIEKQGPNKPDADKERIIDLFRQCYTAVNNEKIIIKGKRKDFELLYNISCTAVIEAESADNVYNITISCEHSDKAKNAELIEKAHIAFKDKINTLKDYHIIVANDEVSEYYCNRIYPSYQKFERQLRHLIFKIVTKAYGHLWTTKTLSPEQKKSLKEEIRSRSGSTKEDVLIEAALHEMNMGQLIDCLFYGNSEIVLSSHLEEHYSPKALKQLSKDELVALIERGRTKSIWNLYLADDFEIIEPQAKLRELRIIRNSVAHCKELHFERYSKAKEYLDMFIPKIDAAIIKANIQKPISIRDVLCGFSEFAIDLSKLAQNMGQLLSPAIQRVAEIGAAICRVYESELMENAVSIGKMLASFYDRQINYSASFANSFSFDTNSSISQAVQKLPSSIDTDAYYSTNTENAEEARAKEDLMMEESTNADA